MLIVSPKSQQTALNPEFIFTMNNKQDEYRLITEQIRVLALQTFPGGRAGPQARVISTHSQSFVLFKLSQTRKKTMLQYKSTAIDITIGIIS